MAYGPEEASRDLTLVGEESASFEVRARLEHHLLSLLREQGCAGVAAFLQSLPEHHFISCGAADPEFINCQPDLIDFNRVTKLISIDLKACSCH